MVHCGSLFIVESLARSIVCTGVHAPSASVYFGRGHWRGRKLDADAVAWRFRRVDMQKKQCACDA
eukprot:3099275-Lingulodinium_polyedra.AAC.1